MDKLGHNVRLKPACQCHDLLPLRHYSLRNRSKPAFVRGSLPSNTSRIQAGFTELSGTLVSQVQNSNMDDRWRDLKAASHPALLKQCTISPHRKAAHRPSRKCRVRIVMSAYLFAVFNIAVFVGEVVQLWRLYERLRKLSLWGTFSYFFQIRELTELRLAWLLRQKRYWGCFKHLRV